MRKMHPTSLVLLVTFAVTTAGYPPFATIRAEESGKAIGRFVLSDGDAENFSVTGEPRYFRPENLWNYINGGALPYIDYGVGDVLTYSGAWNPGGLEIVVDIYDMADSLGAFGIYASERFPEYRYLPVGVEGYLTGNALCFWKDRWYVKVFSKEDAPGSTAPIEAVARAVDSRIPSGGGMPGFFKLFPREGRLPRTEAFLAKNVLGQDFLERAFTVRYLRGDEEYGLYIIVNDDPAQAAGRLRLFRDFVKEFAELDDDPVAFGDEAFTGREDWYGALFFARKGSFIVGSVGLTDTGFARKLLTAIMAGLP